MDPDDFKILKFKVTQIFLRAKVMGWGRCEKGSWCLHGGPVYHNVPFMRLAGDITQEKGTKRRRWGRTGQKL